MVDYFLHKKKKKKKKKKKIVDWNVIPKPSLLTTS